MDLPNQAGFVARRGSGGVVVGKTHLWTGTDTACRMWSTGGMDQSRGWEYFDKPHTKLCTLCHPERHGIALPQSGQLTLFD